MTLELRSKGVRMTDELRSFIERKMRFALGRFGHRLGRVRVLLTDVNGPKGGEDIQCHILASGPRSGLVSIKERRDDPFTAVARATERAGQHLSRHMARLHTGRRGR